MIRPWLVDWSFPLAGFPQVEAPGLWSAPSLWAWVPVIVCLGAALQDLRSRQIHDVFPLFLLAWGIVGTALSFTNLTWLECLGGLLLALVLSVIPYLIGGWHAGDVLLMGALGANVGPVGWLILWLYVSIWGGLPALVAKLRGQDECAYGPAIALGLVTFRLFDGRLPV